MADFVERIARPLVQVPPPTASDMSITELQNKRAEFMTSDPLPVQPPNPYESTEWNYEDRHKAQKVLPYLWIGPMLLNKNTALLEQYGFTMAIGIGHGRLKNIMQAAVNHFNELGIRTTSVNLATTNYSTVFPQVYETVKQHAQAQTQAGQPYRILVFCESGNERSATTVAALLMQAYSDINYVRAIQITNTARYSAGFGHEDKLILQSYQEILDAQRAVPQASGDVIAAAAPSSNKRAHVPDEDDMDDVEQRAGTTARRIEVNEGMDF